MGVYTIGQIGGIIQKRPNEALIARGKETADKLMLHLHGVGMETALKNCDHFEDADIFKVRKQYAVTNKDVFGRLLQQEDIVFSARGGSSYFSLPEAEEEQMNELLGDVRYGMSLRKWVKTFALQAYRADPMGIVFMEVEQVTEVDGAAVATPKAYPTYKSIYSIWEYEPNGRRLEYVCFRLKAAEALSFGVQDAALRELKGSEDTDYFRFCDDEKDIIVKRTEGSVVLATNTAKNPLPNPWGQTPAFMVSDLITFNNPQVFLSPLDLTVELADCFLNDRSVRDLQKKYHGFAKAVEPLLTCPTCAGSGYVNASPCSSCTPPGAVKGTGFKMKTKVSDVARFPLELFGSNGFDFRKIFGYVSPDVEGWEKQDTSLEDLEELIEMTYWGTVRLKRAAEGGEKTAEEVSSNNQPKYTRLNTTADWAERTENMIADFIGRFWFDGFKRSSISYGRYYVLESPGELMKQYQAMKKDKLPGFVLDEALERYYHAAYQANPLQLAYYTTLLKVIPFLHEDVDIVKDLPVPNLQRQMRLFANDWLSTKGELQIVGQKPEALRKELEQYVMTIAEADKKDDTPLAVKLGVGGIQALQGLLADGAMAPKSKQNALVILFGLKDEDAARIMEGAKEPAPDPAPPPPGPPVPKPEGVPA